MKTILSFVAVCFTAAVIGCQTSSTISPGALGSECGAKATSTCTKDKAECCGQPQCEGARLGAVGEKSECTLKRDASECQLKKQSECTKAKDASLGAVSEAECGAKARTECHHNKAEKVCPATGAAGKECTKNLDASLGAVSEKRECGAKKNRCGSN